MAKPWIAFLLLLPVIGSMDVKIRGRIDIAIITPTGTGDFGTIFPATVLMHTAISQIPEKYVEMGENLTRMAVISMYDPEFANYKNYSLLPVPLTGNQQEFYNKIDSIEKVQSTWWETLHFNVGFRTAREQVFKIKDPSRARVIIVFADRFNELEEKMPIIISEARNESEWLRADRVLIYAIYNASAPNEAGYNLREEMIRYTGSEDHIFGVWGSNYEFFNHSIEKMRDISMALFRDVCGWKKVCRYPNANRQTCESSVWQHPYPNPFFDDNNAQCNTVKPQHSCNDLDDCKDECNRRWPWDGMLNCPADCGKTIKRATATAPEKLEHCPNTMECECSSSTVTTTKTTSPTLDSGTTATRTKTPTFMTTPTLKTSTVLPIDVDKSTTKSAVKDPKESKTSDADMTLIIAVIVSVVVGVCLITAIVVAVIVVRKKKQRIAAEAEAAAAAKRKIEEEMMKKKLAAETKSVKKKAPTLSNKQQPESASFSFIGFAPKTGKLAEASVAADMPMGASTRKGPSKLMQGKIGKSALFGTGKSPAAKSSMYR